MGRAGRYNDRCDDDRRKRRNAGHGLGLFVFTIGSIGWSIVALSTGQHNLLLTNGFLTLVDGVGIWRWLGRQARYENGGRAATLESAAARVPTLFAAGALVGREVVASDGTILGTVVDGMLRCTDKGLSYVVVSAGGVAGVGEELRAIDPAQLNFHPDGVSTDLTLADFQQRPVLPLYRWPAQLPLPHGGRCSAALLSKTPPIERAFAREVNVGV